MLTILLPAIDDLPAVEIHLEHSLVSLSKWESIHEKAFFGKEAKTLDEIGDYVFQMLLTENPPEGLLDRLSSDDYDTISHYINSKQSATWFRDDPNAKPSSEIITSELIYYWMIQFQIPFHPAEEWHLNRLMTLIKICGIKQTKPKKMSANSVREQYRQLNAERRERLGTSG